MSGQPGHLNVHLEVTLNRENMCINCVIEVENPRLVEQHLPMLMIMVGDQTLHSQFGN